MSIAREVWIVGWRSRDGDSGIVRVFNEEDAARDLIEVMSAHAAAEKSFTLDHNEIYG